MLNIFCNKLYSLDQFGNLYFVQMCHLKLKLVCYSVVNLPQADSSCLNIPKTRSKQQNTCAKLFIFLNL